MLQSTQSTLTVSRHTLGPNLESFYRYQQLPAQRTLATDAQCLSMVSSLPGLFPSSPVSRLTPEAFFATTSRLTDVLLEQSQADVRRLGSRLVGWLDNCSVSSMASGSSISVSSLTGTWGGSQSVGDSVGSVDGSVDEVPEAVRSRAMVGAGAAAGGGMGTGAAA